MNLVIWEIFINSKLMRKSQTNIDVVIIIMIAIIIVPLKT